MQCTSHNKDDTTVTTADPNAATEPMTGSQWDPQLLETLGLCFTESLHNPGGQRGYQLRFAEYVRMGIRSIRCETSWVSPAKGQWTMSDNTKTVLKTAVNAGLRLKLISPTIMGPPAWAKEDPDASLYSHDGTKAINTLSYWYDGIYEYTEDAIHCQLQQYKKEGLLDSIDALIVDFGPAGEPLYPAAWTQGAGLENPENETTRMWCYGENAVADFKAEMLKKYGSMEAINQVWGTSLTSMEEFQMPAPNTVRGQQWEDILTWYIQSKREFVERQIQIFREAVEVHTDGRVQLILYMPGASYTQEQWDECVETGTATFEIRIGSENEFIVEMAEKYDCLLQFTGLPSIPALKQVRQWMYTNGYGHIPVFGENVANLGASQDPEALYQMIEDFNLAGIDYTFTNYLWEEDFRTISAIGQQMRLAVPKIAEFIANTDFAQAPYMLKLQEAKPQGEVLALQVKLDPTIPDSSAMIRYRIAMPEYVVQEGDVLEYDVMISAPSNGFGFVDGVVADAGTLRMQNACVDQFGIPAAGTGSMASLAGGRWVHRILGIDVPYNTDNRHRNTTGKTLRDLTLLAQPRKINGAFPYLEVTVYYDNIRITNNGEVKMVIFQSSGDLKMDPKIAECRGATVFLKIETTTE